MTPSKGQKMDKDEEIKLWKDKARTILEAYKDVKAAYIGIARASSVVLLASKLPPEHEAVKEYIKALDESLNNAESSQEKLDSIREDKA